MTKINSTILEMHTHINSIFYLHTGSPLSKKPKLRGDFSIGCKQNSVLREVGVITFNSLIAIIQWSESNSGFDWSRGVCDHSTNA